MFASLYNKNTDDQLNDVLTQNHISKILKLKADVLNFNSKNFFVTPSFHFLSLKIKDNMCVCVYVCAHIPVIRVHHALSYLSTLQK